MNHRWLIAAVGAVTVVAAGCGSDGKAASTTAVPGSVAPATAPTLPASKIVSLSPTATEMLYAIGAGDQVIAVDQYSNYPPEVLQKPHDLDGLDPNVEAIAQLRPDLVVMDADNGLGVQLRSVGIADWVGPAATMFDDIYTQLQQLGNVTGHVAEAAEVVADMQSDIKAAVASAPATASGLTYYHELDDTFFSATSNTFIGQVYALFGLKNIADGAQPGNDYPQLSSEFIVQANPDLIFLADSKCCKQDATTVAARPGWDAVAAVNNDAVIPMDDDIASRWSPRIVDYIEAVAAAVNKVPAHSG
jgi:iron complex transport system substrate-binding protein